MLTVPINGMQSIIMKDSFIHFIILPIILIPYTKPYQSERLNQLWIYKLFSSLANYSWQSICSFIWDKHLKIELF